MKKPSRTGASLPPPSCPSDSRAASITSSSLSGRRDSGYVDSLLTLGGERSDETFRVGLYVRVSTDRQAVEGESLDEQETELRKYCNYKNYRIHKVYVEAGKSGGTVNRPEYQKLLVDLKSGKLNAIVVKKLDRLSRSLLDFEALMVTLQTHNVEFISLREQFDTTTAMGKAMLRIALVFAQLEREQTSERISDVMVHRASKGMYNGGVTPFGYICVDKTWQPCKREKPIVELIFKTFLHTRSTVSTTTFLNRDGIKTRKNTMWDCRRVLDILKNPSYIGSRRWRSQIFPDTHTPIISTQIFAQTQELLKTKPHPQSMNAPFQRLLTCGDCGSVMSPSYSLNRTKCRYYYYRCTRKSNTGKPIPCGIKTIGFPQIETRVTNAFARLTHPDHLKSIENRIAKHNAGIQAQTDLLKSEIDQHKQALDKIKTRQENFFDSLTLPHLTTVDRKVVHSKLEELKIEAKQIQTVITKKEFEADQQSETLLDLILIKQHISEAISLDSSDIIHYRNALRRLIQDITVYPSKLTFQFRWIPWPWEIDT
ncbi:hypothetical protein EB093_02840 [bacterium]|nr:hypothetical protein [bacterium]